VGDSLTYTGKLDAGSASNGVPGRFARGGEPELESDLVRRAVARAKSGDTGALHFLYVRFADDVCSYVRGIVRDGHEAEDVTQNVFAKLMTAIRRYEEREVPFAAWITTVARNLALDHVRARRQIPVEEVRMRDEGYDQTGFDRSQSLRAALRRLPEEQREVLVLRHIVGLSPREIAERLGKSEGSIHGLHHRGRGALKASLRELDAAPITAHAI
jgi:RNA polymerase sigma-70 factor (ECF subfamily)